MSAVAMKPFALRRTVVPGEYTGAVWLLKRDDPDVWFGGQDGVVFTGTVYPGGDFREEAFRKPTRLKDQRRVVGPERYRRTLELRLRCHGALARTARDGPGQPLTMKAFYHPISGKCVVAGWDPKRRQWVVE